MGNIFIFILAPIFANTLERHYTFGGKELSVFGKMLGFQVGSLLDIVFSRANVPSPPMQRSPDLALLLDEVDARHMCFLASTRCSTR